MVPVAAQAAGSVVAFYRLETGRAPGQDGTGGFTLRKSMPPKISL